MFSAIYSEHPGIVPENETNRSPQNEAHCARSEHMFRTEASKFKTGNWQLEASCTAGHTVFKDAMHPRGPYKCPYCGNDVT
jgi:hypothetical protein